MCGFGPTVQTTEQNSSVCHEPQGGARLLQTKGSFGSNYIWKLKYIRDFVDIKNIK